MSEIHDTYYKHQTDAAALAKELDRYILHISECLMTDGENVGEDIILDVQAQLYAAKVVRANVKRVFEE